MLNVPECVTGHSTADGSFSFPPTPKKVVCLGSKYVPLSDALRFHLPSYFWATQLSLQHGNASKSLHFNSVLL